MVVDLLFIIIYLQYIKSNKRYFKVVRVTHNKYSLYLSNEHFSSIS